MRKRTIYLVVLSVGLLFLSGRARAHHAFTAEFDASKKVTMKGTIAKMEWVNPHSWLWIDVKGPDGKVEQWGFEFGTATSLYRRGWTKSSVPIGGEVTVTCYLAKDTRKIASADEVTLPDGRTLFAGADAPSAPGPR